jgi:MerR family redox-sensitive transcriptional activator SoxR
LETIPIGELARRTGLSQSAIRYYESQKLLTPPGRKSGWRAFDSEVVDRLHAVRMARELGFTLKEIRTLLDGFSEDTPPSTRWQQLARRKLPEIDAMLNRAMSMKRLLEKGLRCDCVTVQDCIQYDCAPPVTISRRNKP